MLSSFGAQKNVPALAKLAGSVALGYHAKPTVEIAFLVTLFHKISGVGVVVRYVERAVVVTDDVLPRGVGVAGRVVVMAGSRFAF